MLRKLLIGDNTGIKYESLDVVIMRYRNLERDCFTNDNVAVLGKIKSIRNNRFVVIKDNTNFEIQLHLCFGYLERRSLILFKFLRKNDLIFAFGRIYVDKIGNVSIMVKRLKLIASCKVKNFDIGLMSVLRKFNNTFRKALVVSEIRRLLSNLSFTEVETPILISNEWTQLKAFKTYCNNKKTNLQLRVSPEFYLKRLVSMSICSGIFEIAKSFRNEGESCYHSIEFNLLELYSTKHDFFLMISFLDDLFLQLGYIFNVNIPISSVLSLTEVIREETGFRTELINLTSAKLICSILSFNSNSETWAQTVVEIFNNIIKNIKGMRHVIWFPSEVSVFSKPKHLKSRFSFRFETYWNGIELVNAYEELNDVFLQKCRCDHINSVLLQCLNLGLTKVCGVGIGIDRLIMLMFRINSIKQIF